MGEDYMTKLTSQAFLVSLLTGALIVSNTPAANAGTLDVYGGVISWSDKMYIGKGCSQYEFNYINGTGARLLVLGFSIVDPYGQKLTDQSEIGIEPGISGTWTRQICNSSFTNGTGPYRIKGEIKTYSGTQRQAESDIYFLNIPSAIPTPKNQAPIESEIDFASQLTKLNAKINSLESKIRKICSIKPRPKYC
jgi:hypothetical protein